MGNTIGSIRDILTMKVLPFYKDFPENLYNLNNLVQLYQLSIGSVKNESVYTTNIVTSLAFLPLNYMFTRNEGIKNTINSTLVFIPGKAYIKLYILEQILFFITVFSKIENVIGGGEPGIWDWSGICPITVHSGIGEWADKLPPFAQINKSLNIAWKRKLESALKKGNPLTVAGKKWKKRFDLCEQGMNPEEIEKQVGKTIGIRFFKTSDFKFYEPKIKFYKDATTLAKWGDPYFYSNSKLFYFIVQRDMNLVLKENSKYLGLDKEDHIVWASNTVSPNPGQYKDCLLAYQNGQINLVGITKDGGYYILWRSRDSGPVSPPKWLIFPPDGVMRTYDDKNDGKLVWYFGGSMNYSKNMKKILKTIIDY